MGRSGSLGGRQLLQLYAVVCGWPYVLSNCMGVQDTSNYYRLL